MKFYNKKNISQEEKSILLQLERRHTMMEGTVDPEENTRRISRANSLGNFLDNDSPSDIEGRPAKRCQSNEILSNLRRTPTVVITESELSSSKLYKDRKAKIKSDDESADDPNLHTDDPKPDLHNNDPEDLEPRPIQDRNLKPVPVSLKSHSKKSSCCCYFLVIVFICFSSLAVMAGIGAIIYMELFSTYYKKTSEVSTADISSINNASLLPPKEKVFLPTAGEQDGIAGGNEHESLTDLIQNGIENGKISTLFHSLIDEASSNNVLPADEVSLRDRSASSSESNINLGRLFNKVEIVSKVLFDSNLNHQEKETAENSLGKYDGIPRRVKDDHLNEPASEESAKLGKDSQVGPYSTSTDNIEGEEFVPEKILIDIDTIDHDVNIKNEDHVKIDSTITKGHVEVEEFSTEKILIDDDALGHAQNTNKEDHVNILTSTGLSDTGLDDPSPEVEKFSNNDDLDGLLLEVGKFSDTNDLAVEKDSELILDPLHTGGSIDQKHVSLDIHDEHTNEHTTGVSDDVEGSNIVQFNEKDNSSSNGSEPAEQIALLHPAVESKAVPVPVEFLKRMGIDIKNANTHQPLDSNDMEIKFSLAEALKYLRSLDTNNTLPESRIKTITKTASNKGLRKNVKPAVSEERQQYLKNLRKIIYDEEK